MIIDNQTIFLSLAIAIRNKSNLIKDISSYTITLKICLITVMMSDGIIFIFGELKST